MARANKYASLNFNDIYEKKLKPTKSSSSSPSPSSSPSSTSTNNLHKSHLSAARTHGGRMLVLTRPTPKPISIPQQPSPPPPQSPQQPRTPSSEPDQTRFEPDSVSLRPLGRTGSGPSLSTSSPVLYQGRDREVLPVLTSPKPDRFVPPHLRPGFVGREEKFGPEVQKQTGIRSRDFGNRQGHYGSPGRYGEDGRPKSGGGYERMRRGGGGGSGESDMVEMSRPISSGNRPSSSGCCGNKGSLRGDIDGL